MNTIIKCEEVELAMIDYLDNSLDKEYRARIEKHLETCERCMDTIKDFQHILDTVDSTELEQPDESLRVNFYHMLQSEVNKHALEESKPVLPFLKNTTSRVLQMAAGIALLITGTLIGVMLTSIISRERNSTQLSELQSEVQNMKELVMLNMLKAESSSQRIQAMGYTEQLNTPDRTVLDALTETLNNDKNVNVRLAAAYSLARYADRQSVRDSLVASLSKQTEPIIQVVLINILVDKKETSAVKPLQQIISSESTLKEVKDVAEKGIEVLL